jgi:hypothetical protein
MLMSLKFCAAFKRSVREFPKNVCSPMAVFLGSGKRRCRTSEEDWNSNNLGLRRSPAVSLGR